LKRSGKGARAAQAERGSLGKPLAGARGKHPLAAFAFVVAVAFWPIREGRCGEGTAPLRRVAEDCTVGRRQGGYSSRQRRLFVNRKDRMREVRQESTVKMKNLGGKRNYVCFGKLKKRRLLKCTLLYDGSMKTLFETRVHFGGDRSGRERIWK
jgi:hypothetical protein